MYVRPRSVLTAEFMEPREALALSCDQATTAKHVAQSMIAFTCVTELNGFTTAVALVRPCKSIHDVDVKSVKKKLKDKDFAAKVNREDIIRGAAELGMPLDELITKVIAGLREAAPRLGLEGNRVARE